MGREVNNYLFIDDSGSKDWDTPYAGDFVENPPARSEQNLNFWRTNYFVLAGIHINSGKMSDLNSVINTEKAKVFGTKHVEIHSSLLRNPKARRKHYLDRYNIDDDALRDFIENFWYPLYTPENMQLFAVVVDKRYYNKIRGTGKIPLELAAETLFDRTELHPNRECKIIFDQMDEQIRSDHREQGKVLRIANTRIDLEDGKYKSKYHHSSVGFENSKNSNFLQLADIVAYNVWRQFVDYGDEWERHIPGEHRKLPMYSYFKRISDCFYHDIDNRVSGFGLVKLPDPKNKDRRWKID